MLSRDARAAFLLNLTALFFRALSLRLSVLIVLFRLCYFEYFNLILIETRPVVKALLRLLLSLKLVRSVF